MTNPCDIRNMKIPVEPKNITELEYEPPRTEAPGGGLWLGYKNGSIVMFNRSQSDPDTFTLRCKIEGATDLPVRSILRMSQPSCMVCHWCGRQQGPVETVFWSGSRVKLFESAKHVSVSKNPSNPVFGAVVYDEITDTSKIYLKRLSGENVTNIIENEVAGCVRAFGVTNTQIIYYIDGCYWVFRVKSSEPRKLNIDTITFPMVCSMDDDRCVVAYSHYLLVVGNGGDIMIKLSPFYGDPKCVIAASKSVYIAYEDVLARVVLRKSKADNPQLFNVTGLRQMAAMGNELAVVTYNEPLLIGDLPPAGTLAGMLRTKEKQKVLELLDLLETHAASDLAFHIFEWLWKDGHKNDAFELISRTLLIDHVPVVIALVPLIMQVRPPSKLGGLIPLESNDTSMLPQLLKFLEFTRKEYLRSKDDHELMGLMSLIDTSLAQVLAVDSRTRDLANLLEDGNVNSFILKEFSQVHSNALGLGPGYAVLLTYLEQTEEAMNLWIKLDDLTRKAGHANNLFLTEASITLRTLDDSSKLARYLDWLLKSDPASPKCALEALMSPKHDPDVVDDWLKRKNLSVYKLKCDCYRAFQPGGEAFANKTLLALLNLLKDMNDPSFDRSRLAFTRASSLEGDMVMREAKEGIEGTAMQLILLHGNVIDGEKALAIAPNVSFKKAIYQVKGRYRDGLNLLCSHGEFRLPDVAEFCRGCKNSAAAFAAFLDMLDRDSLVTKYGDFIEENLVWMNPVDVVKRIPAKTEIKAALQLVKASFSTLQYRKRNLERQIAMTQSMMIDSKAQMTMLQANSCTVGVNTVCATCGKVITPDSRCFTPPGRPQEIYHQQCKPGR